MIPKGSRTAFFFGITFILGIADACGGINLTELLQAVGVPGDKVGSVMTILSAAGVMLRALSTSPIFTQPENSGG